MERCQRCCQTGQTCIYMDVANDPTAPRPPNSSQPVVVPDSPISVRYTIILDLGSCYLTCSISPQSPSEPPSPSFKIYHTIPSSSEQAEGIQYAPHLARIRHGGNNPLALNPPSSMPNTNPQAPGPSQRNVHALTSAYAMASNLPGHHNTASYLPPLLPTDFFFNASNSDLYPDHLPILTFEDSNVSSYGLP
jgi:hypothetical protein